MRMGRVPVLLAVVAAILIAGIYLTLRPATLDFLKPTTTINDPGQINKVALGFVGSPFPDDYGILRIPGWVDNRSNKKMRRVTLQIQLLDEKSAKKEKITYVVTDIEPATRKTFDLNAGTLPSSRSATISIQQLEVVDW